MWTHYADKEFEYAMTIGLTPEDFGERLEGLHLSDADYHEFAHCVFGVLRNKYLFEVLDQEIAKAEAYYEGYEDR